MKEMLEKFLALERRVDGRAMFVCQRDVVKIQ